MVADSDAFRLKFNSGVDDLLKPSKLWRRHRLSYELRDPEAKHPTFPRRQIYGISALSTRRVCTCCPHPPPSGAFTALSDPLALAELITALSEGARLSPIFRTLTSYVFLGARRCRLCVRGAVMRL